MADITNYDLQQIAVTCANAFFNDNVPLNEALVKEASARELTSEQLKRAVEATNTLTYLKTAQVMKKTAEFAVADYDEIVKVITVPQSMLVKQAQVTRAQDIPGPVSFEKQASEAEAKLSDVQFSEFTPAEARKHLYKYAEVTRRSLQEAEDEYVRRGQRFLNKAASLKEDESALEKLAASSATDDEYSFVTGVIFGQFQPRPDYVQYLSKQAGVNTAEELIHDFRELRQTRSDIVKLSAQVEQIAELEKKAFLPVIGSLGARGVTALSKVMKAPEVAGKAIRKTTNVTLDGLSAAVKGTGTAVKSKVSGSIGGTGATVGKPKSPLASAVVFGGGGAALDAASYSPTVDPIRDRSGKVWDALNKG